MGPAAHRTNYADAKDLVYLVAVAVSDESLDVEVDGNVSLRINGNLKLKKNSS